MTGDSPDRRRGWQPALAGVQGRFQIRGEVEGRLQASSDGASRQPGKAGSDRRVISELSPPHRYTRTSHLRGALLTAFHQSDALIGMDIARLDDGSEQPNRR